MISIDTLRELCNNKRVKWTSHILMKLQERGIQPSDIVHCIADGRIIEDYPEDYPFPSCLTLGTAVNGKPLHVVLGVGQGFAWLITAYFPDNSRWNNDYSARTGKEN